MLKKLRQWKSQYQFKNFEAMGGEGAWAFEKIDQRFRKPLFVYVRKRINNDETAEEVVQDVLLKIYRFRESYDPKYNFSTWLWTVARNTVLDWQRKESVSRNMEDLPEGEGATNFEEIPSTLPNAESLLCRKGEKKKFLQVLRQLTRLQKKVVWLRVVHQLSYQEISKKLGVSLSAVKCAAYRARLTLTSALGYSPAFA